jgi:hypothetical protein
MALQQIGQPRIFDPGGGGNGRMRNGRLPVSAAAKDDKQNQAPKHEAKEYIC